MGMILGWLIDAATRDSRTNRSRKASSSLSSGISTLSAILFPNRTLSARYTTLIPPLPRTPSITYPAKSVPIRGSPPGEDLDPTFDGGSEKSAISSVPTASCRLGLRCLPSRARLRRDAAVFGDELLHSIAARIVVVLHRRRLHEVGARPLQRTGEAVVEPELGAADSVDHDAGRVGRVDHLQLELEVQGHVAEAPALHADVRTLAVVQPLDVVARPDVPVARAEVVVKLRRDRVRLRDLLRLQSLALEHVQEVSIATHVQLVGALEAHTTIGEQPRQLAVDDGCAHLRLDVIADDRQAMVLEAAPPVRLPSDEHRHTVHKRAPRLQHLLHIPLRRLLRTHRQVTNDHVGLGGPESVDQVVGLALR